jgi:indolepyruvate ferredoxin oxidoreductase alpha subunit
MNDFLTANGTGREDLLSGNQAVARACVEAGVSLAIGFPGTPTTPVVEMLARSGAHISARWAVNEKVALDFAAGFSWGGMRSLVTLKMSGLNVAADTLLSVAASGTEGGLVLYVGDDPNVYYGMVEQDSRHYARLASVPMLCPSSPQEMLDLTVLAFDLSERIRGPVFLLATTVLANTYSRVALGELRRVRRKASFSFDIDRWTKAGSARCSRQHQDALARVEQAGAVLDELNTLVEGTPLRHAQGAAGMESAAELGVVATGVAWDYLEEVLERTGLDLPRLKVTSVHPFPRGRAARLLARVRKVLVLEELDPIVEEAVRAEATRTSAGRTCPVILGKDDGTVPRTGDLSPDSVRAALAAALGRDLPADEGLALAPEEIEACKLTRLLTFCPGCPHRSTYYALIRALSEMGRSPADTVVAGDIGCTILGMNEPFNVCWTEVAMGNSVALAAGLAAAGVRRPVVAALGDGTFFHAGLPPLLDAVAEGADLPVIVLDNNWMSMTGMQETVGTEGRRGKRVTIEQASRGLGVRSVSVRNPYRVGSAVRAMKRLLASPGVNVLVMRAPCVARRPLPWIVPVEVIQRRCPGVEGCGRTCIEALACPALVREGDRVLVSAEYCQGCGLCSHYCPKRAIRRRFLRARRRER